MKHLIVFSLLMAVAFSAPVANNDVNPDEIATTVETNEKATTEVITDVPPTANPNAGETMEKKPNENTGVPLEIQPVPEKPRTGEEKTPENPVDVPSDTKPDQPTVDNNKTVMPDENKKDDNGNKDEKPKEEQPVDEIYVIAQPIQPPFFRVFNPYNYYVPRYHQGYIPRLAPQLPPQFAPQIPPQFAQQIPPQFASPSQPTEQGVQPIHHHHVPRIPFNAQPYPQPYPQSYPQHRWIVMPVGAEYRNDEVRNEVRRDEVRPEEVRNGEVRLEEVRRDEVRPEEVRNGEVRLEEVRPEEVRNGEVSESNQPQ